MSGYLRHMCQEYPELKQEVYADVLQAAELIMRQMEHKFIDKIFEQGDLDNLKAQDLKRTLLTKRTNEKLVELRLRI